MTAARAALVALAVLVGPGASAAHTLGTGSARLSLRDGHVELTADLDLFLLGLDPTALATASPAELDAALARLEAALVDGTRLEADGAAVALVVRDLPRGDELRAVAAVLSASGRDHGELVRLRFEAPAAVDRARTLAVRWPAALGPMVTTFVQPATRYAAAGAAARFEVLGPGTAVAPPSATVTTSSTTASTASSTTSSTTASATAAGGWGLRWPGALLLGGVALGGLGLALRRREARS